MRRSLLITAVLGVVLAQPAGAQFFGSSKPKQEGPTLEDRLERLERMLDSGGLVDLLSRMEMLQQEVRELRGLVESQTNELEGLKKRQRDLYVDLDQRMGRLEGGAVAEAPGATPATAPPPVPVDVPPAAAPAAAPPSADETAEQSRYEAAFAYLKQGRYDDAVAAFTRFLAEYPGGTYAPNAQYWLGEAYYVTRRFDQALEEFEKVPAQFPDSGKVPDSLLKIGYIHHERGDRDQARDVLGSVKANYPGTTAAQLADRRLKLIAGGG